MKQRIETSKKIILAVMLTYFTTTIIGSWIVLKSHDQLAPFLTFIGAATSLAIGGYLTKSGVENKAKIQHQKGGECNEQEGDSDNDDRSLRGR